MKKRIIPILLLCLFWVVYLLWPTTRKSASSSHWDTGIEGETQKGAHHLRRAKQPVSGEQSPQSASINTPEGESKELAVMAPTGESFSRLANEARARGVLLSTIPALRLVRLRGSHAKLKGFLATDGFEEFNFYENRFEWLIPEKDEGKLFSSVGAPFGYHALRWMGIDESAEERGKGVRIALLDTAVNLHSPSLSNASIEELDLFGLGNAKSETGLHGTMVASLLVGENGVSGCVPDASILSIPVLSTDGFGSSHDVAQAIVTAVDKGTQIIGMSLGFLGSDPVLEMAVDYAISRGVLIVAAAGNEGMADSGESTVLYPAAYEGVLAIGAIDANSQRPEFSSTGNELALVAPGVGLIADDGADLTSFSGTSASVPCAVGSIAYIMASQEGVDAAKATELLLENANDLGLPSDDPEYGLGGINAERALNADTPGIHDGAAADVAFQQSPDGTVEGIYFTAQNRGTEELARLTLVYSLRDATTGALLFHGERQFEEVAAGGSVSVALQNGEYSGKLFATIEVHTLDDANPNNNIVKRILEIPNLK